MLRELQELRAKVAQLELEAAIGPSSLQADTANLAQGADLVEFYPKIKQTAEDKSGKETKLSCSWDTLLSYFGPNMLAECTDEDMMSRVKLAFYHAIPSASRSFNSLSSVVLPYVLEDKIRVQFQALGYIATGLKKRAVADKSRYWRLTPVGEKHLISIRAERRKPNEVAT
jgi:hypothetical protein